uniref:Uncharacterized protein n=1 Tax=Populus trichocarpa TaxID=3694 RepID=A0A3N7ERF8_POPTR|eukprot:XP_024454755.1 uncharacterized protein LOC18097454 [Populus trichocarpa]
MSWFSCVEDGLVPEQGCKPWASALDDGNAIMGPNSSDISDCEVMMMVGLPASGKTTWAEKWAEEYPEKRFVLLGRNLILDEMKVCLVELLAFHYLHLLLHHQGPRIPIFLLACSSILEDITLLRETANFLIVLPSIPQDLGDLTSKLKTGNREGQVLVHAELQIFCKHELNEENSKGPPSKIISRFL